MKKVFVVAVCLLSLLLVVSLAGCPRDAAMKDTPADDGKAEIRINPFNGDGARYAYYQQSDASYFMVTVYREGKPDYDNEPQWAALNEEISVTVDREVEYKFIVEIFKDNGKNDNDHTNDILVARGTAVKMVGPYENEPEPKVEMEMHLYGPYASIDLMPYADDLSMADYLEIWKREYGTEDDYSFVCYYDKPSGVDALYLDTVVQDYFGVPGTTYEYIIVPKNVDFEMQFYRTGPVTAYAGFESMQVNPGAATYDEDENELVFTVTPGFSEEVAAGTLFGQIYIAYRAENGSETFMVYGPDIEDGRYSLDSILENNRGFRGKTFRPVYYEATLGYLTYVNHLVEFDSQVTIDHSATHLPDITFPEIPRLDEHFLSDTDDWDFTLEIINGTNSAISVSSLMYDLLDYDIEPAVSTIETVEAGASVSHRFNVQDLCDSYNFGDEVRAALILGNNDDYEGETRVEVDGKLHSIILVYEENGEYEYATRSYYEQKGNFVTLDMYEWEDILEGKSDIYIDRAVGNDEGPTGSWESTYMYVRDEDGLEIYPGTLVVDYFTGNNKYWYRIHDDENPDLFNSCMLGPFDGSHGFGELGIIPGAATYNATTNKLTFSQMPEIVPDTDMLTKDWSIDFDIEYASNESGFSILLARSYLFDGNSVYLPDMYTLFSPGPIEGNVCVPRNDRVYYLVLIVETNTYRCNVYYYKISTNATGLPESITIHY